MTRYGTLDLSSFEAAVEELSVDPNPYRMHIIVSAVILHQRYQQSFYEQAGSAVGISSGNIFTHNSSTGIGNLGLYELRKYAAMQAK